MVPWALRAGPVGRGQVAENSKIRVTASTVHPSGRSSASTRLAMGTDNKAYVLAGRRK